MEEIDERKFACRFCSKKFPCGKSLGGHIRVHMKENSAESEEDDTIKLVMGTSHGKKVKRDSGLEAAGCYGLRENPKKTKRFADQTEIASQYQLFCTECGKGFNSLKALCGHMACHSDREKVVMDSQSDTETSSAPLRRRSKRAKHKAVFSGNQFNTPSYANRNSSPVSEIEQEQELAMWLMMLSRDSSFKKGNNQLSAFAESSDNNSVILEAKSSSADVRTTLKTGVGRAPNADAILGMKNNERENGKFKSPENNALLSYSDNSDSGYFRTGLESDVSVDGFLKTPGFNNHKLEFGSGSNDPEAKLEKIFMKVKPTPEIGNGEDRGSTKHELRRSKRVGSYDPHNSIINSQKKTRNGSTASARSEAAHESRENSLETGFCADARQVVSATSKVENGSNQGGAACKKTLSKKKTRAHECPICFRVFKSGQALGGHKRSHFLGNQEESTVVINEELPKMRGLIDLNLPASTDE